MALLYVVNIFLKVTYIDIDMNMFYFRIENEYILDIVKFQLFKQLNVQYSNFVKSLLRQYFYELQVHGD